MKISCPNCSAAYELDDNRVPPAGLSIKCPKCKNPFTVHKPKPGEAAAAKPAKAGGAVPLPGMGDESQSMDQTAVDFRPPPPKAPSPAPDFSAIPLPGLDDRTAPAASESGDPFANLEMGAEPKAPAPDLDLPEQPGDHWPAASERRRLRRASAGRRIPPQPPPTRLGLAFLRDG